MAKALELTWVAKLRQWRKRRFVKGKRKDFYLGTGAGKDDRQSYQLALAKWKVKEAELDAAKAESESQQKYRALGEMLAARGVVQSDLNWSPTIPTEPYSRGDKVHPSMQRYLEEKPTQPKPKEKLLNEYIDDYVAEQRERFEHGLKFPDAPQHERKRSPNISVDGIKKHAADFAVAPTHPDNDAKQRAIWGKRPRRHHPIAGRPAELGRNQYEIAAPIGDRHTNLRA